MNTTENPDGSKEPEGKMAILSSQHNLNLRVNTLLGVVNMVGRFVGDPESDDPDRFGGGSFVATERARKAAEDTFSMACSALDVLLADRKLWDCQTEANAIDNELEKLADANVKNAKARLSVVEYHARPSVQLGCVIGREGDEFTASFQLVDKSALVGYGRSVDEALDNLDDILNGNTPSES